MTTLQDVASAVQQLTTELGTLINTGIPPIQDGVSEVKAGLQQVQSVVENQDIKINTISDRLAKDEKTIEEVVGRVDKVFDKLNTQVTGLNDAVGKIVEQASKFSLRGNKVESEIEELKAEMTRRTDYLNNKRAENEKIHEDSMASMREDTTSMHLLSRLSDSAIHSERP